MIIRAVNGRRLFKYLLLFIAAVVAITAFFILAGSKVVGAFEPEKELPIYSVDTNEKNIALTFDCAWGADDIPEILDTLKNNNVKATFFIVGQWAEKNPEIVRRIANEGHDVANHGYSHLRMGSLDRDKIKSELEKCGSIISNITGNKIDLFRPPYGDYNNDVIKISRNLGYYSIQWDVDSLDWKPDISQSEIIDRVMRKVKNGSILLFHNDTAHTAKLLPTVISKLKNENFGFVPVSGLIMRDNYIIDFEGRQKIKQ